MTGLNFFVVLVLVAFLGGSLIEGTGLMSCNELESKSATLRLRKYLFCEYDQTVRPAANYKNKTVVGFSLLPRSIIVDSSKSTVDLHAWLSLNWKDPHLTWDPSQYEGVNWINVKSYEVWVPDVVVHTAGAGNKDIPYTSCMLSDRGGVFCVPSEVYTLSCDVDHTWWPYDVMNCTAQFGSWAYSMEDIDFQFTQIELTLDKYELNLAWEIERTFLTDRVVPSKYGENYTSIFLGYHMILRRHSTPFSISYVVPSIVIMVMTLLTLWLEPKSFERMIIANLSFVCHLLCMQNLIWRIPYSGTTRPRIMIFYEISLILSTLSLILTSFLRQMQELTVQAPVWISSSTASLLRSKIGQILLVSILDPKVSAEIETDADDNTDLVSSTRKEGTWQYATIIIGWVAFLIVLIAYFIAMIVYLPTAYSGSSFKLNS